MSNLSEELINKIMLYVSHPCADLIRNCITINDDGDERSNYNISNPPIACMFNVETSLCYEKRYEREVVERNILNQVQQRYLVRKQLEEFKQINHFLLLYLYFNRCYLVTNIAILIATICILNFKFYLRKSVY
jgi:hypothetical protein